MSTELTVAQPSVDWPREKVDLIKRMCCVGASDDELQLFLYTCKRTGLDPLAKQIHMVKRWNAPAGREVATIQTGIDGYRLIADRTGKLAGITDPTYGELNVAGHPVSATVTVKKLVGTMVADFTATARFSEYVQTKKDGAPNSTWSKMPFLMLGKCAEALALRKAFPADLSGIYTADEMQQADSEAPIRPSVNTAAPVQTEAESPFSYDAPKLTCQPIDIDKRRSKGKDARDFIAVKLNGTCEGQKMAFCWHVSLFDVLLSAMHKPCEFEVDISKDGKFLNIERVLSVDGVLWEEKPAEDESTEPLPDDPAIPF